MIEPGRMSRRSSLDECIEADCMYLSFQEDFCDHVGERYNLVYHQQNSVARNALFKEKIAEVVQHVKTTTFFHEATPPQPSTHV